MILRREASLWSDEGLKQCLGTAISYCMLIAIANHFLMTHVGFELRPGAFIPVVAGLLFGLPAAVGSFLGNLVSSLLTGYDVVLSLYTSSLNFLLAYTLYRLWYGYQSHKATLYVYNNRTFLKFVLLTLYGGSNLAILAALFMYGSLGQLTLAFVFVTFINNFAFPLLLGLPILLLWDKYADREYYRPREEAKHWHAYCRFAMPTLIALNLLGLIMLWNRQMDPQTGTFLGSFGLLLWAISLQQPSDYETHPEESDGFNSLVAGFAVRLFVGVDTLVLLFLFLWIGISDASLSDWRDRENWLELGRLISVCLSLLIGGSYLVLLVVESSLTQRLKVLCARVQNYLAGHDLAELKQGKGEARQDNNELDVLEQSLNRMGEDITRYLTDLDSTIAEQEAIHTQLNVAQSIQQGILPKLEQIAPRLPAYTIAGGMQAAKTIGGDAYDAFLLDEDHLIVSIADVSGKGIPAALFMMTTQALLRQNAHELPLAEAVQRTNDALVLHNEQCLFVTVWIAQLELSTGHITYVNAGHNPTLLAPPGAAKAVWLEELSGPVLGLMPELDFILHEADLPVGGRLMLYTDGLNEAENTAHEFFGNERLEQSFLTSGSPEQVIDAIHDFVREAEQSDDMTYLWLERKAVTE